MLPLLIIAIFAVVVMHDAIGSAWLGDRLPAYSAGLIAWGGSLLVWLGAHARCVRAARRLDASGNLREVAAAEAAVSWSRLAAVMLHATGVLMLGWLEAVRGVVGDTVVLDELVVVAPALSVFVLGWWSVEPVERRLREAAMVRALDEGTPLYRPWSRRRYVWSQVRHQLLFVLVPVACLGAWSEIAHLAMARAGVRAALTRWGLGGDDGAALTEGLIQFAGAAAVFSLMPIVLRRIWDTIPLGPGPLRDAVSRVCARQGVRPRDLLVWRTNGTMVNAAVIGLVAPLRYILLTDGLLDHLDEPRLEAVTAHEVAHIRRHHMAWLVVVLLGVLLGGGIALSVGFSWALRDTDPDGTAAALATAATLVATLVAFGFVSRRFEWQADAFAAAHLSGSADAVTPEAVGVMASALQTVARLGGMPSTRFTWRHGSIAARQRRLRALTGRAIDRLPIDRQVRAIKGVAAGVLVVSVLILAAAWWWG